MREIDLSPTVVERLALNSSDSDSDIENSNDDTASKTGLVEGGTSSPEEASFVSLQRTPRETISFDVNIIFDRLFDQSQIQLTTRQRGPEMVEQSLFVDDLAPKACAEYEQTRPKLFQFQGKDKNAKLLLSLNSELLSRDVNSGEVPKLLDLQRPIWGTSVNPTLVKAIQEDIAHVLSEKYVCRKPTSKVRPYHVTVAYLAEIPSVESAAAIYASDGPLHQEQEVEELGQREQEQRAPGHTRYQLSLSVLLPRGVSAQSVREVVRDEVHNANSVWRRSAPPFYSLDPDYIRESTTAAPQASLSGSVTTQLESVSQIPEGLPPRHPNELRLKVEAKKKWHTEELKEQQCLQSQQLDHASLPEPRSDSDSTSSDDEDQSDDSGSSGASDDDDDADEEIDDVDPEEDDGAGALDPATQAFATAIDRGSSAEDACRVGLEVICTLLHDGGVPQAALEALQERAKKAFRHARIKGAPPLEAWRLVGESAESGDLF